MAKIASKSDFAKDGNGPKTRIKNNYSKLEYLDITTSDSTDPDNIFYIYE